MSVYLCARPFFCLFRNAHAILYAGMFFTFYAGKARVAVRAFGIAAADCYSSIREGMVCG